MKNTEGEKWKRKTRLTSAVLSRVNFFGEGISSKEPPEGKPRLFFDSKMR